VGAKPVQRAPQKPAGGHRAFVRQQFHIRDAGVIVDGDVQVFPALAAEPVKALPRDAMPEAANPAQLLGIDMEQIADGRVLVPAVPLTGC
jgi:hypothetical protein